MKRTLTLVLLLVFTLCAISVQAAGPPQPPTADVNVVNEPTVHLGSVYRFAGFSTATTDGAAGGTGGLNTICQAEFGGNARICTTKEVLLSSDVPAYSYPSPSGWVLPTIVGAVYDIDNSRFYYTDFSGFVVPDDPTTSATCAQWGSANGVWWGFSTNGSSAIISRSHCDSTLAVTCCTPAN